MNHNDFINRHIGIDDNDLPKMLNTIGCESIDDLIKKTIPKTIMKAEDLSIDKALNEEDYLNLLKKLSYENKLFDNYIGQDYYGTYTSNDIKEYSL